MEALCGFDASRDSAQLNQFLHRCPQNLAISLCKNEPFRNQLESQLGAEQTLDSVLDPGLNSYADHEQNTTEQQLETTAVTDSDENGTVNPAQYSQGSKHTFFSKGKQQTSSRQADNDNAANQCQEKHKQLNADFP